MSVGAGPPVLVLHGFPTASYDFSRIAGSLAEDHQVICFDYPGFGFSDKPTTGAYSLMRYADAAQFVINTFGFKRIFVLAHDIGDSVALEILRRHSPIIERLVLLNGSVFSIPINDSAMLVMQKLLLHPVVGAWISAAHLFRRSLFIHSFKKLFFRPLTRQELLAFWALIRYNNGMAIYHLLIRYMHERRIYQDRWIDALRQSSAPLTLIWGQADPVAPPIIAEQLIQRRPDATYIRLPAIGHYPHWEAPAQVSAASRAAFA